MNTYNIETSICDALNLPKIYQISDHDFLSAEKAERSLKPISVDELPPGCSFAGMKHTEKTKMKMSKTMSDGRRKKPKTLAWKTSRSNNTKGILPTWILRKKVIYNGVEYPTIKHAATANNVHRRVIRKHATLITHESS